MSDANERGLLHVQIDIDPAHEEDFNRWFTDEHFPAILAFPGILGGRRFRSIANPQRYLAIYDIESPAILQSPEYLKVATSPWTQRISQHFTARQRDVFLDVTPAYARKPDASSFKT